MSADDTYQGWTNWDTWDANLWLTNDQDSYLSAMDCEDAHDLEITFKQMFKRYVGTELEYIDSIDPEKVNWAEIFASLHEGEEQK